MTFAQFLLYTFTTMITLALCIALVEIYLYLRQPFSWYGDEE